jgi:phosphoesterase RecJ-like protein
MTLTSPQDALTMIKNAENILIAPSSPDGDSIGSALAMMRVLQKIGKQVTVVSTNAVPDYLKFLPFTRQIQEQLASTKDFVISLKTTSADVDHLKYEVQNDRINIIVTPKQGEFSEGDVSVHSGLGAFDLVITVDTGDLVQLGSLYEDNKALFESGTVLNIDHHASNGKFGSHNFLDYSVAATTQMLTPLMFQLEKEHGELLVDEDVATLLLVGIVTDTGSFQHSNTTPEAFEVAADLLERGARQQEIIKHIFKTKSLATLKLWGRVLSKIQYENELVYSTISQQDLADTGANSDDSGGIIDELMSNAPNAEVVMLMKEKDKGFVTGSLRAPGSKADVSEIAKLMGGGGHKKAAGFRIRNKNLEEALEFAKTTIFNYLNGGQNAAQAPQAQQTQESGPLFPGLVMKPQQTSVPAPSPGGEDLLLQDFRKQQNPEEERVKEQSVRFFQDSDGQQKPEPTVGEVLNQMQQGGQS